MVASADAIVVVDAATAATPDAAASPDAAPIAPDATAAPAVPLSVSLDLDWTLTRVDDHLHLTYTIHNPTQTPVFLLDHLLVGDGPYHDGFDRAIVQAGPQAGVVELVRGYVPPPNTGMAIEILTEPAARRLDPGQTLDGAADIPLPLTAWHNFARSIPLRGKVKRAVLAIGYLTGWDSWGAQRLDDGTTVTVPQPGYLPRQQFVRSVPLAIP